MCDKCLFIFGIAMSGKTPRTPVFRRYRAAFYGALGVIVLALAAGVLFVLRAQIPPAVMSGHPEPRVSGPQAGIPLVTTSLPSRVPPTSNAAPIQIEPRPGTAAMPSVAIIIDDLGNNRSRGLQAVRLPGPVAVAILPHTPDARRLARAARAQGKEVLLHLPMQPESARERPGPGELTEYMDTATLRRVVLDDLASVPEAQGVNNHMGSLLTQDRRAMDEVMSVLARRRLFFVDSFTSSHSQAMKIARRFGLPVTRRNVFLDDVPHAAAIDAQFRRLLALARRHGTALAIGHPFRATLDYLSKALPQLAAQGVRLVSVRVLIQDQTSIARRRREDLSHSSRTAEVRE